MRDIFQIVPFFLFVSIDVRKCFFYYLCYIHQVDSVLALAAEKEKSEQLEARVAILEQEVRQDTGSILMYTAAFSSVFPPGFAIFYFFRVVMSQ